MPRTGIWDILNLVFSSNITAKWKPISQLCALPDLQTVSNRAHITDTEIWAKLDPRHYWKVEANLTIILCSTTPGILQTVRNRAHVIDTEIWAKLHKTPARRDKGDIVVFTLTLTSVCVCTRGRVKTHCGAIPCPKCFQTLISSRLCL